MDFNLIVSKKAQAEIENAIDYYNEINENLGKKFYVEIEKAYQHIIQNPYYQIKHKGYRALPITKFLFFLFYHINEDKKLIKILSCFHTAKSEKKYPK